MRLRNMCIVKQSSWVHLSDAESCSEPFHTALLLKDPSFSFSVGFSYKEPAEKDVRYPEEVSVFELTMLTVTGHFVHLTMILMMKKMMRMRMLMTITITTDKLS